LSQIALNIARFAGRCGRSMKCLAAVFSSVVKLLFNGMTVLLLLVLCCLTAGMCSFAFVGCILCRNTKKNSTHVLNVTNLSYISISCASIWHIMLDVQYILVAAVTLNSVGMLTFGSICVKNIGKPPPDPPLPMVVERKK
jgi:hypothetical protein